MSDKTSINRGPKQLQVKTRNVTYTMTGGSALCALPKGSRFLGVMLTGGTAANTATTATIQFGTSAAATDLTATANVLAAGIGTSGGFIPAKNVSPFSTDVTVYVKYAESGGTSNAGAWRADILYTTGNAINDDTI